MPLLDGVGYSEPTKIKIEHLGKIFDMHLAITQAVLNKYTNYVQCYRYVDLTSGKGYTPDGTKGSPLVFLESAESAEFKTPYCVDFIERNENNLTELKVNMEGEAAKQGWQIPIPNFHPGDYQKRIPKLFSTNYIVH
ncbi:MAG: hypothetical protein NT075_34795 [Chloroflexi bacterium]|nr:hypothetical protein [Chloroflexota bacterium]